VLLTYLEYNTVVALCQVLVLAGNSFFVLLTYLEYNTVVLKLQYIQLCCCVSFLVVAD
jgi:hypothetical protein